MANAREIFKANGLLLGIITGVIIGCVIGSTCHSAVNALTDPSPTRVAMYIKFPGELFIRMLKMIVVPLIVSSIIVAVSSIPITSAGRLGKRTLFYYLFTSITCSVLGLILVIVIQPGRGVDTTQPATEQQESHRNSVDNILDLIRNAFPDNIVEAMMKSVYTRYTKTPINHSFRVKNLSELTNMTAENMAAFLRNNLVVPKSLSSGSINEHKVYVITNDVEAEFGGLMKGGGTNMIGLIVFSIAFGAVLNILKDEGKPLVDIFESLWKATMKLVEIIMWISPVGIASIIAGNIIETKDISSMFRAMGLLLLTNVSGYIIIGVLLYPLLYLFFFRRSPLAHIKNVLPALVTAFGTNSSAATLPTTIQCCETRANINKQITRFVLPIGATCNMDGSALYFAIVVPFIDQIEPGFSLGTGKLVLTVIIATLLSIGAAGIPSPGLTNTIIALEAVGLPTGKMGPIFAIEWISGRLQTVINVLGDTYTAAIVEKLSLEELDERYEDDEADKMNNCKMEIELANPLKECIISNENV